ncbi:MAG TPA: response regulator, partial [Vicinamibacterales bacterium]
IAVDVKGEMLELKNTINTMVDQLRSFASEVTRVAREVGTEGRLGVQAVVPGVAGTWKDLTDSVNIMGANLTAQVRNIAEVTTAVARGDLSRKITVDVKGEILELKNTINTMVDQLRAFGAEVTRVAREVGTEGKLGGQAEVPGVAGTWKDLTDSVNVMAANLTDQVRGIVKVVTAVANGNLRQKLTVEAKGEVAALGETINNMTDTLAIFAEQVTNVAREVGVEGRLGGQAHVPGAAGTWKDLTGNVNLLAANLTNQVRAIAEVATAVTKGDLTRSIQVEARGEVAELKDNINTMIDNLRGTTDRNQEQDWLKTNLAKFTRLLQGQRDLVTFGKLLLSELAPLVGAQQGSVYQMLTEVVDSSPTLSLLAGYAVGDDQARRIDLGQGLVGQCALEKQRLLLTKLPRQYARIHSSLGSARPKNVVVLPVLFEGETKAVIELSSLQPFTATHLTFLDQLTESIGVVLNTIEATMRTENLLQQSQQLTIELQTRQTELQQTNEELASKAKQLAEQNIEVERKNNEVEQARRALEEKAAELALTSKYKSEFLANMSHELRTPLNSILILGQQLAANADGNLAARQVDFARNIHSAGTDLLALINDILDLSKIESGTVTVEAEEITFGAFRDSVERGFHHVAESRNLAFRIDIDKHLPRAFVSDPKRLQQIVKNLLSNAFKFTAQGHVLLSVRPVSSGWSPDHPVLPYTHDVVAIAVTDTGIGIAPEKQRLIFEAFQQADAGTSRKYGGTGLGLAISRELATLLGGEIKLTSVVGQGSTFTLYLPMSYSGPARTPAAAGPALPSDARSTAPALPVAEVIDIVSDDREHIAEGDQVLLIIDDDPHYARVLLGMAREKGFKGLVAHRGAVGIALARQFKPTAVALDVFLPDMLGWTVLSQLKLDPATRHIPVQILSVEEERQHGLSRGAFSYLVKPATTSDLEDAFDRLTRYVARGRKRLLIVEDNEIEQRSIAEMLHHDDIDLVAVGTGADALRELSTGTVDCCVLDLRLPDMSGFDLLEQVRGDETLRAVPVVVFTGKELTRDERAKLEQAAKSIVLKDVQSPERLFDETALFLHRVVADLPEHQRAMLERLHGSNDVLKHQQVLIVDDDARNIFALTTLLENEEMDVITATNGLQAIDTVKSTPGLSAVLMDIMMPGMDGYETIRRIRKDPASRMLPILALTAKAMKGDREKCLQAGASDYIAKPVNTDELLSLLRVWLYR